MPQPPISFDINNNKSIITALRAGDENVFDAVYRYYFRRLCAFFDLFGELVGGVVGGAVGAGRQIAAVGG